MADEECDIFKFASHGLKAGHKRGPPKKLGRAFIKRKLSTITASESPSASSSSSEEDDETGSDKKKRWEKWNILYS